MVPRLLLTSYCLVATFPALAVSGVVPRDLATSLSLKNQAFHALRAVVTTTDMRGEREANTTFILTLSRDKGWRIDGADAGSTYTFINDYSNDLRLFGKKKEAQILRAAGNPNLVRFFRKPLTDLDALSLLSPESLVYKGTESMDRTTVHRFAGSTTTQFLDAGDPIRRNLEVWVGEKDGLARRTVESADGQIGVTVYSQVEVNPVVKDEEFSTKPPDGFGLKDMNEELDRITRREEATTATAMATEGTSEPVSQP
jgi:hypothetical protein